MNFKEELLKFEEKFFSKELEDHNIEISFDQKNIGQIETSLKTEIRKSSLILQNKLDTLKNEISNLNLENEDLKKQLFRNKRELDNAINLLFKSIDIFLPLNNLLDENNQEILDLMKKKLDGLLKKSNIEETAQIGNSFNYKYHEILNENLNEKENYIIKTIISQGYIRDGQIIRIAKVIVE